MKPLEEIILEAQKDWPAHKKEAAKQMTEDEFKQATETVLKNIHPWSISKKILLGAVGFVLAPLLLPGALLLGLYVIGDLLEDMISEFKR